MKPPYQGNFICFPLKKAHFFAPPLPFTTSLRNSWAPEEKALKEFCITNFVVNHWGGKGTAEVLGECSVKNIPRAYQRWQYEQDKAWCVSYRNKQGKERQVYAVYHMLEQEFKLYKVPKTQSIG